MEKSPKDGSPSSRGDTPEDGECDPDDINNLFVIDNTPASEENVEFIPTYKSNFDNVLAVNVLEKQETKPKTKTAAASSCWNCNGPHSLRDCTAERNPMNISRNRQKFMCNRPAQNLRYHLDFDQKFLNIQPGQISKKLRWALGLRSNQLPKHIYRMREIGYPPGWVEEARVVHSGLSLFGSEGKEVADPGYEEGEVTYAGEKDKFDISKIIKFPGFNCAYSSDTIDEFERFRAPPMLEEHSIERMMKIWAPIAARSYKRKKMTATTSDTPTSPVVNDMDLTVEDQCEEDNVTFSIENKPDDSSDGGASNNEMQTEKLEHSKSPSPEPSNSNKRKREVDEDGNSPVTNDFEKESCEISSPSPEFTTCTPNRTTPNRAAKKVVLGTPVIVTSEFKRLPNFENFSKNICDVICFENLPDSTGKYERMSGLLKKVRKSLNQLCKETDSD